MVKLNPIPVFSAKKKLLTENFHRTFASPVGNEWKQPIVIYPVAIEDVWFSIYMSTPWVTATTNKSVFSCYLNLFGSNSYKSCSVTVGDEVSN